MSTNVFKRKEKKYLLDAQARAFIEDALAGRMHIDGYGRTRVTSVYLDTPTRSVISRSLEKPRYKEKVRIRAYGEALGSALVDAFAPQCCTRAEAGSPASLWTDLRHASDAVFVELKKKYKGIVYKRRVETSLAAAAAWMRGLPYEDARLNYPASGAADAPAYGEAQIAREIEAALRRHEALAPSMAVTCMREAWTNQDETADGRRSSGALLVPGAHLTPVGDNTPELRITFDGSLEHLDLASAHLSCQEGAFTEARCRCLWKPTLPDSFSVMEIKCEGAYPLWLVRALSDAHVYPVSFSKYGRAATLEAAERAAAPEAATHADNRHEGDRPQPATMPDSMSPWLHDPEPEGALYA